MKRLFARNCEVREVSIDEERNFLNENHKQGYVSSTVCFGLYNGGELVQIESFGVPRIENQNRSFFHDWELLRECSKKDYYVLGGKSKLLKAFERKYNPISLLSYCSLTEGFDGHSYIACGFKEINRSGSYHYEKDGEKISRNAMQKSAPKRMKGQIEEIQKTIEKFGGVYNPNETERENAKRNGFVFVEEIGNITYEKNYSDFRGYVYKTTNLLNGKIYIGQHVPKKKSIYYGSGTLLKPALEKYGKNNFKVEVLQWCRNQEELNEAEVDWINNKCPECLVENGGYNIKTTSQGDVDYSWMSDDEKSKIWKEKISKAKTGFRHSKETKKYLKEWHKDHPNGGQFQKGHQTWNKGIPRTEAEKEKMSTSKKAFYQTEKGKKLREEIGKKHKGLKHSEESKKRMSVIQAKIHSVEGYGKRMSESCKGWHWWTDGITNVKTKECPPGFHSGRIRSW